MKIQLLDTQTNELVEAEISPAIFSEMPLKKDGWQFNWRELFRLKGAMVYKLTLTEPSYETQGMLVLKMLNDETVEMKNIELASQNIGKNKRFDLVAGCLIAYACFLSFKLGKNGYEGCLTFESKTRLIPHYRDKYRAMQGYGARMFIEVYDSRNLIKEYLNIEVDEK